MSATYPNLYPVGTPSAAVSCVRFLEAMEAKHPELFRGPGGVMAMSKPDGFSAGTKVMPEESARMVALCRAGESVEGISAKLCRAPMTVMKHLEKAGLYFIRPRRKGRTHRS